MNLYKCCKFIINGFHCCEIFFKADEVSLESKFASLMIWINKIQLIIKLEEVNKSKCWSRGLHKMFKADRTKFPSISKCWINEKRELSYVTSVYTRKHLIKVESGGGGISYVLFVQSRGCSAEDVHDYSQGEMSLLNAVAFVINTHCWKCLQLVVMRGIIIHFILTVMLILTVWSFSGKIHIFPL